MFKDKSKNNKGEVCLTITVQKGYPFEIKLGPQFWAKLALSLSKGLHDLDLIENVLKGVYCLALKSAMNNNVDPNLSITLQEDLNLPLSKLKKVICSPSMTTVPNKLKKELKN